MDMCYTRIKIHRIGNALNYRRMSNFGQRFWTDVIE
jgi:hypothetical protein